MYVHSNRCVTTLGKTNYSIWLEEFIQILAVKSCRYVVQMLVYRLLARVCVLDDFLSLSRSLAVTITVAVKALGWWHAIDDCSFTYFTVRKFLLYCIHIHMKFTHFGWIESHQKQYALNTFLAHTHTYTHAHMRSIHFPPSRLFFLHTNFHISVFVCANFFSLNNFYEIGTEKMSFFFFILFGFVWKERGNNDDIYKCIDLSQNNKFSGC